MPKPQLYDDQKQVLDEVLRHIKAGQNRILIFAETGTGKTTIAAQLMAWAARAESPCLFIVPDEPLINQTVKTVNRFGFQCGVIKSGIKENRHHKIQIAGIDTLINRKFPIAEFVFADEAHGSYAPTWRKVLEHYWKSNAIVIGLTATPYRTDPKEGLGEIYDCIVKAPAMAELIQKKRLVPPRYYGFPILDLSSVRKTKGDYKAEDLDFVVNTEAACDQIVSEWENKAANLRTIAFTVSLGHSDRLQAAFQKRGYNAVCVDGRVPFDERPPIYQSFANGDKLAPQILISVDVLEQGFDIPAVGCIIQARPTISRRKNKQQIGRGTRPFPGKEFFIVLDYAGNAYRFGFVDTAENVSLTKDGTKTNGEAPVKPCPRIKGGCGALLHLSVMKCPYCDHEFARKQKHAHYQQSMVPLAGLATTATIDEKTAFYICAAQTAFKKEQPPAMAIASFQKKFNSQPTPENTIGAVFGLNPSDNQKTSYRAYLQRQALKSGQNWEWVEKYMKLEFGG